MPAEKSFFCHVVRLILLVRLAAAMDSDNDLTSTPAFAVILEMILSRPDGITEDELLASGPDAEESARALEILSAHGLIERAKGSFVIRGNEENLENIRKIILVFRELNDINSAALIIRGILTATEYYRCLVHKETLVAMVVEEGVDRSICRRALALEERHGYIERLKINYRSRGRVREKFFPFIPYHHYHDFAEMTGRAVEAVGDGLVLPGDALELVEEQYLLGNYSEALAGQARQYMSTRNARLLEKVRNEAFDIVWCYDKY